MTEKIHREIVDLAGSWALVFDRDGQGIESGWGGSFYPDDLAETIRVPGIWNIQYPGRDGVGFYKTSFRIPPNWQDRQVELVFEGVSYLTSVWINGKFVGGHEGAYTPFRFNITDRLITSGENLLIIRVSSLSKAGEVDGLLLKQAPAAKQAWHFPFGGIWGKIHLEALPNLACTSIRLTPDVQQQQVHVELSLQNTLAVPHRAELKLTVKNSSNDPVIEQVGKVNIPPGANRFDYHFRIPSPHLWTCQNPSLYLLRTELVNPQSGEVDIQEVSFGMREFSMRAGQCFLNGEPLYIRGVLLQPDYPISLVTPPDPEMLEREIRLAKEAGFNLIRIHLRPAAPGFLDLADKLGILVYAETSLGWIKDSSRLMAHGLRETEALIRRDYNHPSIVFWGIYNENPPAARINGLELAKYARSLDASRVVIHNSGGSLAIDQDFGWIERTWVLPAQETTPQKGMDIHLYLGCYPTRPTYHWLQFVGRKTDQPVNLCQQGFGSQAVLDEFDRELHDYPGKILVSEIGCGGFNNLERTAAGFNGREDLLDAQLVLSLRDSLHKGFQQRGLEKIFGSFPRLFDQSQEMQSRGMVRQVEAILTNPRVSGFILTALNDAGFELEGGILDMWRNPKPVYHALKRLNQPHCLVTAPQSLAVSPGGSSWLDGFLLNQVALEGREQIIITVRNPAGDEISRQVVQPEVSAGVHPLQQILFQPGESSGSYLVSTRLARGSELLAETSETIYSLPAVNWVDLKKKIQSWGPPVPLFQGQDFDGFFLAAGSAGPGSPVLFAGQPAEVSPEEWTAVLRAVDGGCVGIIGALNPDNGKALERLRQAGIAIELHPGYGSWMGCHHWLPRGGLTDSLPSSGGIAGELFADVLPRYSLTELGGSVLAGCIVCTRDPDKPKNILWCSDIEKIPFGKGKLIFCQYRLFEQPLGHSIASRFAYNLFRLALYE